jgi:hypothetical protein
MTTRKQVTRLAFRPEEAAQSIGVSHDFFKDNIAPELPWVRLGPRIRLVPVSQLQAWLERNAAYAVESGAATTKTHRADVQCLNNVKRPRRGGNRPGAGTEGVIFDAV